LGGNHHHDNGYDCKSIRVAGSNPAYTTAIITFYNDTSSIGLGGNHHHYNSYDCKSTRLAGFAKLVSAHELRSVSDVQPFWKSTRQWFIRHPGASVGNDQMEQHTDLIRTHKKRSVSGFQPFWKSPRLWYSFPPGEGMGNDQLEQHADLNSMVVWHR
jgi:hypothetical protein